MRTLKPCIVKVSDGFVNHAWDCLPFGYFLVLQVCSMSWYSSKLYMLPDFTPNMKMLEKHADKGSEDWEIYAECVREAMSKYSGMPISNSPLRNKINYEAFMVEDKPTIQVGDQIFSFDKNGSGIIEAVKDEEKNNQDEKEKASTNSGDTKHSGATKDTDKPIESADEDVPEELPCDARNEWVSVNNDN